MDFEDFVRARLHSLIRYATLLTGSRELAEDIVQEALMKAHWTWLALRYWPLSRSLSSTRLRS